MTINSQQGLHKTDMPAWCKLNQMGQNMSSINAGQLWSIRWRSTCRQTQFSLKLAQIVSCVCFLGVDILARAKNGTGKTGAYSIPLIQQVDPTLTYVQGEDLALCRPCNRTDHLVLFQVWSWCRPENWPFKQVRSASSWVSILSWKSW